MVNLYGIVILPYGHCCKKFTFWSVSLKNVAFGAFGEVSVLHIILVDLLEWYIVYIPYPS